MEHSKLSDHKFKKVNLLPPQLTKLCQSWVKRNHGIMGDFQSIFG